MNWLVILIITILSIIGYLSASHFYFKSEEYDEELNSKKDNKNNTSKN